MSLDCRENPTPGAFSRLGRMPRSPLSSLVVAIAAAALGLAACGEEDAELLPGGTAREITANLDAVQQLADEGDCLGAESAAQQVSEQIAALEGVDGRLKRALEDGADRLNEVIAGCEEPTDEAISPAVVPEEEEDEEKEGKPEKPKPDKDDEGDGEEGDDEGEPTEEPSEGSPGSEVPPPHSEGQGKGPDGERPPEESEEGVEESPSGGVSPSAPVPEGE
jgi:hypothetical protein